jgi:hypothetical protein
MWEEKGLLLLDALQAVCVIAEAVHETDVIGGTRFSQSESRG